MSQEQHKAQAPSTVTCAVVTVSDTRTRETDRSGAAIAAILETAGHQVAVREIVKDDPVQVAAVVREALVNPDVQVVITTGGTGITSRDSTYEAIEALLEKRLHGFGELFRMLSYADIGPAAMLSRATAGTACGRVVFALPGSEGAVRLAMDKLIVPELGHLVQQVRR
jgi:molybdenum cofactor biosynthesis protein B